MKRTTAEIAAAIGVSEPAAAHLVAFLRATDLIEFKGERPVPRGKGPFVYEVPRETPDRVRKMLDKAAGR